MQESKLWPKLFKVLTNDLNDGLYVLAASKWTIPSWENVVSKLEGRAAVQRDLDRLEKWDDRNLTEFSNSTEEGITPFTSTCSGPTACKTALQKRT